MDIKKQILNALGLSEEIKLEYQAKLEDGTIIVSSADSLSAGADISILTEDGSTMPLPPGEYKTEDGIGFSVTEEGVVAEIYDEEAPEEEVEAAEEEAPAEEAPAAEEVKEVITDEVASATEEIATAIDEATGDEVTPEVAEAAAEIAVAIVEEKVDEVALNKQIKVLTDIIKKEFTTQDDRISNLENMSAGEPVKANKFSNNGVEELSKAEYNKLGSKGRFFYNLSKSQK